MLAPLTTGLLARELWGAGTVVPRLPEPVQYRPTEHLLRGISIDKIAFIRAAGQSRAIGRPPDLNCDSVVAQNLMYDLAGRITAVEMARASFSASNFLTRPFSYTTCPRQTATDPPLADRSTRLFVFLISSVAWRLHPNQPQHILPARLDRYVVLSTGSVPVAGHSMRPIWSSRA